MIDDKKGYKTIGKSEINEEGFVLSGDARGKHFTVKIQDLDLKGVGQAVIKETSKKGNIRRLKLAIPYTIPGEVVEAEVKHKLKRRFKGQITNVIEAHEQRMEPRCPHFGSCGGCTWQHWAYDAQSLEKTNQVKRFLLDADFDPTVVGDVIGMDDPWEYRNKMEFTFAPDGSLGLHEPGNFRKIIPLHTCHIMGDDMLEATLAIANWVKESKLSGYEKEAQKGLLRNVMVRRSYATGEMMLAIFATDRPETVPAIEQLTALIQADFPQVKSLLWLVNTDIADRAQSEESYTLLGRDFIYDEMIGYRYRLWFDTFFQTNPTQAEKLVELALEMAEPKPTEKMIDLFCGVGTFSLPFASKVGKLAGIEIVETSIQSAKRNAEDNGIDNTYFLAKDARHGIDEVLETFGRPELLLLDPPRSGAGGKVMRRIARSKPERIVYVSCNPETFARDIKELVPFGYQLQEVQPVDLFPHTYHVELVALLSKE